MIGFEEIQTSFNLLPQTKIAMEKKWITHTPMMKQWIKMKTELGEDVILFCRIGDFYELFYDDAVIGAKELDIALTARKIGDTQHPLAGVPVRSVDSYVSRLVSKGYKVAIADQLEDPKAVKGVVKRGVTRIVTQGTIVDDSLLSAGKNNYIASLVKVSSKGNSVEYGLAIADLSVGEFYVKEFKGEDSKTLLKYSLDVTAPVEFIFPEGLEEDIKKLIVDESGRRVTLTERPSFWFEPQEATEVLHEHFEVRSLKGFGIADSSLSAAAAGALIRYLMETQMRKISNITKIQILNLNNVMMLDKSVIRSLEIFENTYDHTETGTLVSLLDETKTPMGGRMLRRWLAAPLVDPNEIEKRWRILSTLYEEEIEQNNLRAALESIHDIERIATRISLELAKPSELIKLKESLEKLPSVIEPLRNLVSTEEIGKIIAEFDQLEDVLEYLTKWIHPEPASSPIDGAVIADGVNSRLDELRKVLREGERWVENYQQEQIQLTGITSLKIKQNRQLGYYIEVTRKNADKVPENYVSRQAMVNAIRYVTDELKEWESNILNAEVEIAELETQLYQLVLENLAKHFERIHQTAQQIAFLDCLSTFAEISLRNGYVQPKLVEEQSLIIKGGRHPVIESFQSMQEYVPNDVKLDKERQQILVITGPNYSGKSSLLRMVAINVILAQIGCFVPANEMKLSVHDRIFTRIGASDNLIAGQSTFMVEMLDAANFINNSTERSLIIADEIGRGTSTYDGLAIAWAIAEYLHNCEQKPLTMIATHYHQLSELEGFLDRVKNFHFKISFDGERPIFNHKLFRGSSDKSFGVEVAKLAGLPLDIIIRARFILKLLESQSASIEIEELTPSVASKIRQATEMEKQQASLADWFGDEVEVVTTSKQKPKMPSSTTKKSPFQMRPEELEVIQTLKSLSIENLTPIKAFQILQDLKTLVSG